VPNEKNRDALSRRVPEIPSCNVRKQRLWKKKTSAEEYLEIAPWQKMHIGHATYIVSTYQLGLKYVDQLLARTADLLFRSQTHGSGQT
jgi:hypothetical protein